MSNEIDSATPPYACYAGSVRMGDGPEIQAGQSWSPEGGIVQMVEAEAEDQLLDPPEVPPLA